MGRCIRRAGAGCVGVLAGLAVATSPALAHTAAKGSVRPNADTPSAYLGGFDVVPPEGISSDGSTFKMPTISCPQTGIAQYDVLGEMINSADGDFFQSGGQTDAMSGALLVCSYGTPSYRIDALTNGGGEFTDTTGINPGDTIQTRVEELPSGDALATTTDQTTGQMVTSEGTSLGNAAQIYEGLIPDASDEMIQSNQSIVTFKSVLFTRSQVGSVPLRQLTPTATDLNQTGTVMVSPSAISPKTPGRFTLTEKSSQ
jgi:hypothetical protein